MPAGDFFAQYPERVAQTCLALREAIRSALPQVQEEVDPAGRVVGYNCGPGYAGLICTIIPSKAGVKLGIVNGATLPNPDGLRSFKPLIPHGDPAPALASNERALSARPSRSLHVRRHSVRQVTLQKFIQDLSLNCSLQLPGPALWQRLTGSGGSRSK
ncbi:hypothetical protein BH18ACI5_BH18ACI5_25280 [soil metagenome]